MIEFSLSRRFYQGRVASLLTAVVLIFVTLKTGAAGLPDQDPAREWRGREYADVLYTRFRNIYPQIPLAIDPAELTEFAAHKDKPAWTFREGLNEFKKTMETFKKEEFRPRVMASAKNAFPKPIAELIHKLEFGERLYSSESQFAFEVEMQLESWISKQRDNSVYMDDLMIETLRLSNGRVITAWLAAWNLLREEWSYASTRNYRVLRTKLKSHTGERHLWKGAAHFVPVADEDQKEKSTTLHFSSGDSDTREAVQKMQMVITKRGDEYSYIYHRLGVELLAMAVSSYTQSATAGWGLGSIGALGEFFKYTKTAGLARENKKRVANDLAAASSGARFYNLVSKNAKPPLSMREAGAAYYLRSNKWKFGKSYELHKGVPAHYFGSQADAEFIFPAMTVAELKLRFAHAGTYDSLVVDPVVLMSGDDYERMHRGLADYISQGANDPDLNLHLRQFVARVEAIPETADVVADLNLDRYQNWKNVKDVVSDSYFDEAEARLLRHVEKVIAAATLFERKREIERMLNPPAGICRAAF